MTPEEVELCERGQRDVVNSYGRLVAKDSDGRVVNSGSATFLQLDGMRLIGTADHVAVDLPKEGDVFLQVFHDGVVGTPEAPLPPLEFPIDLAERLPLPNSQTLDVAAIIPPPELPDSSHIKWLNAQKHADVLRDSLRPMVANNQDPRLSAMILGFPRFARFDCPDHRIQISGAVPIWALLQQITNPPAVFDTPSQVNMEIDLPCTDSLPADTHPLFQNCIQQLDSLCVADQAAIGGYSGAPVIYFCSQGWFLIGIMKQGGLQLGGLAFATPIDVFVGEIRQAQR